jgi:hypothetical protein
MIGNRTKCRPREGQIFKATLVSRTHQHGWLIQRKPFEVYGTPIHFKPTQSVGQIDWLALAGFGATAHAEPVFTLRFGGAWATQEVRHAACLTLSPGRYATCQVGSDDFRGVQLFRIAPLFGLAVKVEPRQIKFEQEITERVRGVGASRPLVQAMQPASARAQISSVPATRMDLPLQSRRYSGLVGLVRLAGIEPTTLGFGGQYSIH